MNYTLCRDHNDERALLFETLDLEKVGQLSELSKFFPAGYAVRYVGAKKPQKWVDGKWTIVEATKENAKSVMVSETPLEFAPDEAAFDRPSTLFYVEGKRFEVNLRTRYNECLSLFKAVGCKNCPSRGIKCLAEGAKIELTPRAPINNFTDEDEFLDELEERHKKMGDFDFVHPSRTRVKNEFSSKFREYWEHSFEAISRNAEELSERAEKAAVSRAFKKDQCSKCVISNSCEAFRHCKGAYPPLADIVTQANAKLDAVLAQTKLPAWQLWEIARNMGKTAKHSRWNIWLAGLTLRGSDGLVPIVKRAKLHIDAYRLNTYDEIAKVFDLATKEEDAGKPVTSPDTRAIWWMALNTPNASKHYGWGSYRYLAGIGIDDTRVTVQWTNGKYLAGTSELGCVADVAEILSYGRLATINKIEVRP